MLILLQIKFVISYKEDKYYLTPFNPILLFVFVITAMSFCSIRCLLYDVADMERFFLSVKLDKSKRCICFVNVNGGFLSMFFILLFYIRQTTTWWITLMSCVRAVLRPTLELSRDWKETKRMCTVSMTRDLVSKYNSTTFIQTDSSNRRARCREESVLTITLIFLLTL